MAADLSLPSLDGWKHAIVHGRDFVGRPAWFYEGHTDPYSPFPAPINALAPGYELICEEVHEPGKPIDIRFRVRPYMYLPNIRNIPLPADAILLDVGNYPAIARKMIAESVKRCDEARARMSAAASGLVIPTGAKIQ